MSGPPAQPPDLAAARAALDGIDDAILDLLDRRAETVGALAASRAKGATVLRPGREAAILRRLVGRRRHMPAAAVVRAWREILAASRDAQGPFSVAVPDDAMATLAREHFGAGAVLRDAIDPPRDVREGVATVAVMPIGGRWWRDLDGLFVTARLPFVVRSGPGALVVATVPPDPSGDDRRVFAARELAGTVLARDEAWALVETMFADTPPLGAAPLGFYAAPIAP